MGKKPPLFVMREIQPKLDQKIRPEGHLALSFFPFHFLFEFERDPILFSLHIVKFHELVHKQTLCSHRYKLGVESHRPEANLPHQDFQVAIFTID